MHHSVKLIKNEDNSAMIRKTWQFCLPHDHIIQPSQPKGYHFFKDTKSAMILSIMTTNNALKSW